MWLLILTLAAWSSITEESKNLTAGNQLPRYKAATKGQVFILTDDNGTPVDRKDISELNYDQFDSTFLFQSMVRFANERIPVRPVHTKGVGAYGYFEVTNDISDICKAKLFSKKGKKTKVVVRFSNQFADEGEPDTKRDAKGFSVKFYTEEGNMDIVQLNFPVFIIKNPTLFTSAVHTVKRNPETRLYDKNAGWDFLTLRRESVLFTMFSFTDAGVPNGFRHTEGYPIHTYQLYNDKGNVSYVRFRFRPDAGVENLPSSEAERLAGQDPDYYARDLYEAILNGHYPSWTLGMQYISEDDIENAGFNPFDVTLFWPEKKYPFKPIGKLILNENLKNHFAENEQLAFCPGNLVPGIIGVDRMFEARRINYEIAAAHRLGANAHKIRVNCPIMSQVHTYFRDGPPPVRGNEGNSPNYFPNSFNGPEPVNDENRPILIKPYVEPEATNFGQARDFYENGLTEPEKKRLIQNIVSDLSTGVIESLKQRAIQLFTDVHPEFGQRIADGLKNATKPIEKPMPIKD